MAGDEGFWEILSTARTIRRFRDDPVDDAKLARGLEAATWAPSGANVQAWRFVVLRSAEQRAVVAEAAAAALRVIEPVYHPRGRHGPLRRRPLGEVVALDSSEGSADDILGSD